MKLKNHQKKHDHPRLCNWTRMAFICAIVFQFIVAIHFGVFWFCRDLNVAFLMPAEYLYILIWMGYFVRWNIHNKLGSYFAVSSAVLLLLVFRVSTHLFFTLFSLPLSESLTYTHFVIMEAFFMFMIAVIAIVKTRLLRK